MTAKPQREQRIGHGYLLYVAALTLWFSMIFIVPLAASYKVTEPLSRPLYFLFSMVCHQRPERSFFLRGEPFAVCARCTFLYLGILISSLLYPLVGSGSPPRARYLLIAASPLVFDAGTQLLGLRSSTNFLRSLTGFLFGMALAFYIAPEAVPTISDLIERIR